jgi:hypothetical protein
MCVVASWHMIKQDRPRSLGLHQHNVSRPKHAVESLPIWKSKQVGETEHLELTHLTVDTCVYNELEK